MQKIKDNVYRFLRWSEKYLKTDMVYIVKGGSWLTAGDILSLATIFLLAIAFANFLSKETYGIYKYILSLADLLSIATLSGMITAVTQGIARGYEGILVPTIKTRIRWGFLATLASAAMAAYYHFHHNDTFALSFLLIAVFLPFMYSFMTYDSFLQGKKLFKESSIYGTVSQVAAAIFMIVTLFLTRNLFVILVVYFASWTLIRFVCLQITLKKFKPGKEYDSEIISYGKHLTVNSIIGNTIDSLDNVIIFHFLGAVSVAVYSFALLPLVYFQSMIKKIDALAIPKLAQRPISEIQKLFWKRIKILFLLGLVVTAVYILVIPFLFKIFFPKYLDAVFLTQIYSLSIALMLVQPILRSVLGSRLTLIPKKSLYLFNISNFTLLFFMFVLVKPLGSLGIIIARILSLLSSVIIGLVLWKKIIGRSKDHQIVRPNS